MTGGGKGDEFLAHPVKDQLPGVDFCLNSPPPWHEAVILGFQHYLVMLGTTVLISSILVPQMGGTNVEKAKVIQTLVFVSGMNTLLQTTVGSTLPVVIGGSYAFLIPCTLIIFSTRFTYILDPYQRFVETMRAIQGALMFASILPILAGFLGLWRILLRFLSPLAAVPLVTLVGLGLFALGFPQLAKCIELGLPALILLILLSQYLSHAMKSRKSVGGRYAVLGTIVIIWALAAILTAVGAYKRRSPATQFICRTNTSELIKAAPWIRFPYPFQWGRPTLHIGDGFAMMAATLVAMIESTGTFIAAARYASATPIPPSIAGRGISWLGIGILLDGMFGTLTGSTASVENAGLLGLNRVGNRRVIQIAGKFGAVLASIPLSIFAAIYCVLFAYVASSGLGLLQLCNLNSFRTKFIMGFALFMGLSIPQYFNEYLLVEGYGPVHTRSYAFNSIVQVILSSPATVGVIVAVALDMSLERQHQETRRDSGRHWWSKFRAYSTDTRSDEFYCLPYGLNKYFPPV
ncbi:hypothetical protein V2J09_011052 [Rumex salicifolius]